MSDLLKRIADYFAYEYDGDDKKATKMELSVEELRCISSMHVEKCRAEAELREMKNKGCSHTNADRIRFMTDEELAEFLLKVNCAYSEPCMTGENPCKWEDYPEHSKGCKDCFKEWLQSEAEG